MNRIGLMSGGGQLPLLIGKSLINKKHKVVFFVLEEYFDKNKYSKYDTVIIKLNSLKNILNQLKKNNIDCIIMAGNLHRPSIYDLKLDFETLKFVKNYFLEKKGDNNLLISIQNFFYNKGYPLFDWRAYCNELFSTEDRLTINKPSKSALSNLNKALEVLNNFGKLDIGQSIIVQNQLVLGVEAAEGTDELIKRCYKYKKKGDKGILVKFSKIKQSKLLDIPTIGLETIKKLKKYDYEGLFLEKGKCIIIDKDKVKNFAKKNKIFVSTVN